MDIVLMQTKQRHIKNWTKYGGQYAAEYVAIPGGSEHQTGLGIDVTAQSVVEGKKLVFGDTEEYDWVIKHCSDYGFIIRFEEGTDNITGIAHEPWHVRYVGKAVAKEIIKNKWTFEEYCYIKMWYHHLRKINLEFTSRFFIGKIWKH